MATRPVLAGTYASQFLHLGALLILSARPARARAYCVLWKFLCFPPGQAAVTTRSNHEVTRQSTRRPSY